MSRITAPLRATAVSLREALANDGIRRLELGWMLGIAADTGLTVVLLIVTYERGGLLATGILGAVRMVPAVVSGMLAGAVLQRVRGDRLLVAIGLIRTASAALAVLLIVLDAPLPWLFLVAALASAAGAPVRPTQATLMPAVARSPRELVAANVAWGTGEGAGALLGPFVVALLVGYGDPAVAAGLAAGAFLVTAVIAAGLRLEQATDVSGAAEGAGRNLRLRDGLRALGRRPVPRWSMLAVYGQVLTRSALNTLAVVAAIELLGMGDGGVGLLNAALGLGGLFGAVFAMSLARTDRLVRSEVVSLAYWGAPIAIIGLLPYPAVALIALIVVGVANAVFDVVLFTIFQRGCSNAERAPVFSVFEGVAGLGAVSGSLLGPALVAAFGARGALAVAGAFLPILALVIYSRIGRADRADRLAVVDEPMVQLMREVDMFDQVPLTGIERLVEGFVPVEFAAGAELMRQGDPGDRFMVIDTGEVEVSVDGRPMGRLGHAAGIGEIALLRRSARTATVTALTDVTGFCVDAGTFLAAVSGPAAAAVTERIAEAKVLRGATGTAGTAT
jgi:MFS family permease